jgi:peptide/nickel transport system substrate-binding protein
VHILITREEDMTKPRTSLTSLNRREAIALPAAAGLTGFWSHLPARAQDLVPKRGGKMVLASRHGSTTDSTDPGLLTNAYQGLLALSF